MKERLRRAIAAVDWRLHAYLHDGAIHNTKAMRLLRHIPDSVIGAVVVDPPARMGMAGSLVDDDVAAREELGLEHPADPDADKRSDIDKHIDDLQPIAEETARVLVPGGVSLFVGSPRMASAWEVVAERAGMPPQLELVVLWMGRTDRRRLAFERASLALVVRIHAKRGYRRQPLGGFTSDSNVVMIEEVPAEERDNLSQRPLSLFVYLLTAITNPGEWVVDPMCGAGSALVAARVTGRPCVGCDIDRQQVKIARDRMDGAAAIEEIEERQTLWRWVNGKLTEIEG